MLAESTELANRFNNLASELDVLRTDAEARMDQNLTQVNELLGRVAEFNREIVAAEAGERTAGDLRDARRLQRLLLDQGYAFDVVAAVIEEQANDPLSAFEAVEALADWVAKDGWDTTLQAYARCARITRDLEGQLEFNEAQIEEEASRSLWQRWGS